ncbi:4'-phosphopantetheinyl transferase family protein [Brevibacillus dissolubilis]|uniref:4'-phosphopantetheinyl transferase family protein n=1 Tax=Brevibacillus dissolubilis TaxID=1844116 RepID=UPI00111630C9|nr:4'-phosphopantetheinyl transferase superfamily protein [Brevibacillus dissolubilis]
MTYATPSLYVEPIRLIRSDATFPAAICFCHDADIRRLYTHHPFLHPNEQAVYMKYEHARRQKSYLLGRYVAKQATAKLIGETQLSRVEIRQGVFQFPIVGHPTSSNVQVSLSHCDDFACAVAFPEEHPLGIDIEEINPDRNTLIRDQATPAELRLLSQLPLGEDVAMTTLWTAKEALSKILRTGMMTPFSLFEMEKLTVADGVVTGEYTNFAQYKLVSFQLGGYICTIAAPRRTELSSLQIGRIQAQFASMGTR